MCKDCEWLELLVFGEPCQVHAVGLADGYGKHIYQHRLLIDSRITRLFIIII